MDGPVKHRPKSQHVRALPVSVVAKHLCVSRETVRTWIYAGKLRAFRNPHRHYTDDRPRKTTRAQWRIPVDAYEEFLVRWRAGLL